MTSTNNRVYDQNSDGCSPGCSVVAGIVFWGLFFGVLTFLDYGNAEQNITPKKEPVNSVDTCAIMKDSMRVYKHR